MVYRIEYTSCGPITGVKGRRAFLVIVLGWMTIQYLKVSCKVGYFRPDMGSVRLTCVPAVISSGVEHETPVLVRKI